MKKIIFGIFILLIIAGAIWLLIYNKKTNEAKTKASENLSSVPVSVTDVTREKLDQQLSLVGTLYPNAEVSINSETTGKIIELKFDVGSQISKGTVLAKVDDEVRAAQLQTAEANLEKAKKDLDRYEQLKKEKSGTDIQLESAQLAYKLAQANLTIAKRQLSDTKILSPISGIITSRNIELGSLLSVNTPIATICDISNLKLKLNVAEKDVFKLKISDKVDIETDVYPGKTFKGTIRAINSKADEAHTFSVEIITQNPKETPLRAGMFARTNFNTKKETESIVIPREALVGSSRDPKVFLIDGNKVKLKSIEIGTSVGTKLEVIKGLEVGDKVVTSGQINIKDGSEVVIIK